ncbi:hypothetical protein ACP275_12G087300 [Erythranthe tilingii]
MASQKIIFLVTLLLISLACAKASLKCESADDCYKRMNCRKQFVHCTNGTCSCHASEQSESVKPSPPPRKACLAAQDCGVNFSCKFGRAICLSGFCSCILD